MSEAQDAYDKKLIEMIEQLPSDLEVNEAGNAVKNFATFVNSRPADPTPVPEPEIVVPMTRWAKVGQRIATVLDNETTRTAIKAAGAFAGVFYVAHATIRRDHVIERQALQQANQRPN